jgi:hypothetical protein
MVWVDKNISTFDMFDSYKPDLFVTHYSLLTSDTVKYLKQSTKVDLILNVTDITENDLKSVESFLDSNKIKCKFMFTNNLSKKQSKIRMENIMPAADLFIPKQQDSPRKIPFAFVCDNQKGFDVSKLESTLNGKEVYHLIGYPNKSDDMDYDGNIIKMNQICPIYSSIMLVGDINFVASQLFFDMTLRSTHCGFFNPTNYTEQEQKVESDKLDGFLGFLWNNNPPENLEDQDLGELMRKTVMKRHSCFNRAERFMKFVGDDDAVKNLQQIQGTLGV